MTRIAIIPARGGSKRIPGKNIKIFCGLPSLARAIRTAQDSNLFDTIVVSTDSDDIAATAEEYGATVPFRRPTELSDDYATTVDVIAHAVTTLTGDKATMAVCCLYPCTPFTTSNLLRQSYDAFSKSDSAYLFPVCEFPAAPQRALKRDAVGRTAPLDPTWQLTRTQDLEPAYYDAGQFYWGHAEAWLNRRPIHSHASTLIVDWIKGVDIDTPEDWQKAEILYTAFMQKDTGDE